MSSLTLIGTFHYEIYRDTDVKFTRTPNKNENPEGFYSTDYYTDQLIGYLNGRSSTEKEKPFFAFLPYTAPHWPLQCSKEKRDKYDFNFIS